MHLIELLENRVAQADEIFKMAEQLAYEEARDQHHGVSDDRILAIAKQLIHNDVRDPAMATAMVDLISDRIHQMRKRT